MKRAILINLKWGILSYLIVLMGSITSSIIFNDMSVFKFYIIVGFIAVTISVLVNSIYDYKKGNYVKRK